MSQKSQFGRIPSSCIHSGILAKLRGAEVKVYLALASHADEEYRCRVGVRRLAVLTGHLTGTVSESIRALEEAGLLTVDRGRNGQASTYVLVDTVRPQPNGLSVQPEPNGERKTVRPQTEQPFGHSLQNRSATAEQNRVRTEKEQQQQDRAAAADDSDNDPIRKALIVAGIGEPARTELSNLPGLTPHIVRDKANWARENGKGRGVLIDELRLASEQHVERQRKRSVPTQPANTQQPTKSWKEWQAEAHGPPIGTSS